MKLKLRKLKFNNIMTVIILLVFLLVILQVVLLSDSRNQQGLRLDPNDEITEDVVEQYEETIQTNENGEQYILIEELMTLEQYEELYEELEINNPDLEIYPSGMLLRDLQLEQASEDENLHGDYKTDEEIIE
jgi:hypothetical protein